MGILKLRMSKGKNFVMEVMEAMADMVDTEEAMVDMGDMVDMVTDMVAQSQMKAKLPPWSLLIWKDRNSVMEAMADMEDTEEAMVDVEDMVDMVTDMVARSPMKLKSPP